MKTNNITRFAAALFLACVPVCMGADISAWKNRQEIAVPAPGVIKVVLPVETMDAALPGLEDLRVISPDGVETAWLLDRPAPRPAAVVPATNHQVLILNQSTVVMIEPGLSQPVEAVMLQIPSGNFVKGVNVEGFKDGAWRMIAIGEPIYRQQGANCVRVPVTPGVWPKLRLTINDKRSPIVPVIGVNVVVAAMEEAAADPLPVRIVERMENEGETRVTLDLGATHLTLASLRLNVSDPLFMRQVSLRVRQMENEVMQERTIWEGTIHRMSIEGQPAVSNTLLAMDQAIPTRELVMVIHNNDNPPLDLRDISVLRRPDYLVFAARQAGIHAIMTGNERAAMPRYDLAAFRSGLQTVKASAIPVSAMGSNPAYRVPETLPGVGETGAELDVSAWKYRKALLFQRDGVQRGDLDLEVMAHAASGFRDLRLMRDGRQIPYVMERTSIVRPLTPVVALTNDSKRPGISIWRITLPQTGLAMNRLVCTSGTPLFQREMRLYEVVSDNRGREYQRDLGRTSWTRTPDRKNNQFVMELTATPASSVCYLETDNGDNPPVQLDAFKFFVPLTRIWFKTIGTNAVSLYYGNNDVPAPRYDLSLVAPKLLSAPGIPVRLGPEDSLKPKPWVERGTPGTPTAVFWGALALVVVALLFVITRMLPATKQ